MICGELRSWNPTLAAAQETHSVEGGAPGFGSGPEVSSEGTRVEGER